MDNALRLLLNDLWSDDRQLQNEAFGRMLDLTEKPVGWAYDVWDEMLANLSHKDNHNRAIAAQLLCNLAKSDPQDRMLNDLPALLAVTKDERFVTARHTMQALWKVGAAGPSQRELLLDGLAQRFKECAAEKNCTLIRYDITEALHNVYTATGNEQVKHRSLELIETEDDLKYRKKYTSVWRAN